MTPSSLLQDGVSYNPATTNQPLPGFPTLPELQLHPGSLSWLLMAVGAGEDPSPKLHQLTEAKPLLQTKLSP